MSGSAIALGYTMGVHACSSMVAIWARTPRKNCRSGVKRIVNEPTAAALAYGLGQ